MQIGGDNSLVTDHRAFALKRAAQLGVFSSPPTVFEDGFTEKPGGGISRWGQTLTGSAAISMLNTSISGVARLDSGATASSICQSIFGPGGLGVNTPALINDPGVAGTFFYLMWVFRIPTLVDAQSFALLEFFKAAGGGTNTIYFGADGKFVSTTKFCLEDNGASAQSSVNIDAGWHYGELWQNGIARVLNFAFDGEVPKSLTITANLGGTGVPNLVTVNGTTATSRQLDVDHMVILSPGNANLPVI